MLLVFLLQSTLQLLLLQEKRFVLSDGLRIVVVVVVIVMIMFEGLGILVKDVRKEIVHSLLVQFSQADGGKEK